MRFATSRNPAPHLSENGEEGQERWIVLELKVMADVGLVGFPSVGKSTLLSVVSAAQPKIGAYHFTTITPNLGVVDVGEGRSFVMADLPGLIEGAHEGVGLGHEFLRHVERTRIIVHVIDMASTEERDPYDDFIKINDELRLYNAKLADRPQIVAANKMDMPGAEEHLQQFREQLKRDGRDDIEIFPISAIARQGVQELLYRAADLLEQIPETQLIEEVVDLSERKIYKFEKEEDDNEFTIRRENDTFIVECIGIERMLKRMNMNSYDGLLRFGQAIRKSGIENALRQRGAKDGHMVQIGDFEFEFVEQQ